MSYATENLLPLQREIREINAMNGWDTPKEIYGCEEEISSKLMLIVTEVAEACEALRGPMRDMRTNFAEELADTVIRVLDLAEGLGINLSEAIRTKMEKNRERGYRHGGKAI